MTITNRNKQLIYTLSKSGTSDFEIAAKFAIHPWEVASIVGEVEASEWAKAQRSAAKAGKPWKRIG